MLDDYLANRLNAEEKAAFEQQVQADPQLAQELSLQQNVIDGIRKARTTELKHMLNNVPVSSIPGGNSLLVKVGTWAAVAGLVVTGIYLYTDQTENDTAEPETVVTELNSVTQPEEPEVTVPTATEPAAKEESAPEIVTEEKVNVTKSENKPVKKEPAPVKPLDVYEPADEEADTQAQFEHEQMENVKKAFVTSSIEVDTDTMSKKYNFHYVFKNNKLILYGAFEENLYEILEFIGDEKRTVVLFYKSNYYLLDIQKTEPTKLTPIHDKNLLKILKAHRSK